VLLLLPSHRTNYLQFGYKSTARGREALVELMSSPFIKQVLHVAIELESMERLVSASSSAELAVVDRNVATGMPIHAAVTNEEGTHGEHAV
jgi:hypothetical protein